MVQGSVRPISTTNQKLISHNFILLLTLLGKRVEGDDKHKGLAIETFGMGMSAQSYTIREGSPYRTALQKMGDAHQNIGAAQSELVREPVDFPVFTFMTMAIQKPQGCFIAQETCASSVCEIQYMSLTELCVFRFLDAALCRSRVSAAHTWIALKSLKRR